MDYVLIREFIERTDSTDHEDAFKYLTKTNWGLNMAVRLYTKEETEASNKFNNLNLDDVNNDKNECLNNDEHPPGEPVAGPSSSGLYDENEFIIENSNFSFILPNFFFNGKSYFKHVKSELIDTCVKNALEQADCLNWWSQDVGDQKLWPMSTLGDGNCLLHAVSIAMWGVHDTLLELRRKLHKFLQYGPYLDVIKRRWKWYQLVSNSESGLVFTQQEWESEWDGVVNLASPTRKRDAQHPAYDGLEEIHVLALSYLLLRPIIVVSDAFLKNSQNEAVAPIPFGGVYIPIGCDPAIVCKSPILLGYDSSHFAPLLCMEKDTPDMSPLNIIPLVDVEGFLLRIKFHHDPGENYNWESFKIADCQKLDLDEHVNYLKSYMNVFDLYNTEEESPEATESKQKSLKHQGLAKQLSGIGKSMSKTIVKKLSSIGTKSKTLEFIKYEMLCAEIVPTMGFLQMCLTRQYMEFSLEQFAKKQSESKRITTTPIFLGVGNMGLGPFKRPVSPPDETRSLYSSSRNISSPPVFIDNVTNTQIGSSTCTTVGCDKGSYSNCRQQNDEFHEYGIGKSVFYKRTDIDRNSNVIPVAKPLSNQTLYLSNSTFYNDKIEDEYIDFLVNDETDLDDDSRKNNNSPCDNN